MESQKLVCLNASQVGSGREVARWPIKYDGVKIELSLGLDDSGVWGREFIMVLISGKAVKTFLKCYYSVCQNPFAFDVLMPATQMKSNS